MRKPPICAPTRSDTNLPVQSQKQARSLKFWVKVEEILYYLCSEKKDADQQTAKLICVFVFAYAEFVFPCGDSNRNQ